jgi:hypothetical protein
MIDKKMKIRAEVWGNDLDRYILRHPIIAIDDVLIDAEAFFKTNSGCDFCGNCCLHGASMPRETAENLQSHLNEIVSRYIPADRRDQVGWHESSQKKELQWTNLVEIDRNKKGCCFLYKDGERYFCSIYSWAFETQRTIYDYWPFECIMYPLAILPYNGILHPGKTFITLRRKQNWFLVDVYGGIKHEGMVLGRLYREVKNLLFQRMRSWRLLDDIEILPDDCYFKKSGQYKKLSYMYFEPQLIWYFGEEFYQKVCAAARQFTSV